MVTRSRGKGGSADGRCYRPTAGVPNGDRGGTAGDQIGDQTGHATGRPDGHATARLAQGLTVKLAMIRSSASKSASVTSWTRTNTAKELSAGTATIPNASALVPSQSESTE